MNYKVYYRQSGICGSYNVKHFHYNAMEVIQIVSGSGTILTGNVVREFEPGDVFVLDGRDIHCISPLSSDDYVRNKLVVDRTEFIRMADKEFSEKITYLKSEGELFDEIDSLFKAICSDKEASSKKLLVLSYIMKLLYICTGNASEKVTPKSGLVSDITDYINKNLQSDLSIDRISKQVHMSKFHICRKFKEGTGMTINNYIKSTRLYVARELLVATNKPVSFIAAEAGFNDLATFAKTFKSAVGMSPTQFRKEYDKSSFLENKI